MTSPTISSDTFDAEFYLRGHPFAAAEIGPSRADDLLTAPAAILAAERKTG